jgi:hypothetical protein
MQEAKSRHRMPGKQLEAMWMAYWDFAFTHTEFYQLMYGIEMNCCVCKCPSDEGFIWPSDLVGEVIRDLMKDQHPKEDDICTWYYTFWSVVHGLVSINIVKQGMSDKVNQKVLTTAITGIIRTIAG